MQIFSVILASIAALAATVMAYVTYVADRQWEERYAYNNLDNTRINQCHTLVSAMARFSRLDQVSEEIMRSGGAARKERILVRNPEADPERLEEYAFFAGREEFVGAVIMNTQQLFRFVETGPIYFSPDELRQTAYEEFLALPPTFHVLGHRTQNLVLERDEEAFDALRKQVSAIAAKLDDTKALCAPILVR